MESVFFLEILVIVTLTLFVLFICNSLKIPLIIGYILSGVLAGPFVLRMVGNTEIIDLFAEIGVIFLLFTIGIQFSLKSLFQVKRLVVLGGSLQLVFTTACVLAAGLFLGIPLNQAIFLGFIVSLSSTAIVMKVLQERGELESPHGRTALAILIFQDLMLIPLMFITPILAGPEHYQAPSIVLIFITGLSIIGVVIVATRYIVPRLLYYSARMKSQEIFLLSVVAICFAIAWIISQTGISLALGAFVAGLMISESDFSVAALSHIMPFRDVFVGFFFISIGMLLDIGVFLSRPLLIIGLALGIIVLKFFTGLITGVFLNLSRRTALLSGLALCQIGEFSFILAKAGESFGLIAGSVYQVILDVTLITMLATPFVIGGSHRIAGQISDRIGDIMGPSCEFDLTRAGEMADHLIIVGFGLNGKNVARVAHYAGIPYRIIDMNPDIVREGCDLGEPIFYGDATQQAVLELAGVKTARIIVIAIADRVGAQQIVQSVRSLNPEIQILVRTRFVSEVPHLVELGADEVIPEEFETSVEIFTRVLAEYLAPAEEIQHLVDEIRAENYELLRETPSSHLAGIRVHLPDLDVASFYIPPESPLAGTTLGETRWRSQMGISVIAIQRGDHALLNPEAGAILQPGDVAVIVGSVDCVREFMHRFGFRKESHIKRKNHIREGRRAG